MELDELRRAPPLPRASVHKPDASLPGGCLHPAEAKAMVSCDLRWERKEHERDGLRMVEYLASVPDLEFNSQHC